MINPSKIQELIDAIVTLIGETERLPLPDTFRARWLRELRAEEAHQRVVLKELLKGQKND